MFKSRITNAFPLSVLAAALLGHAGLAAAQTTGGTTTKTLEYRAVSVTTAAETRTVETYSTQVLGFLAGEMLLTDPAVTSRFGELSHDVVNGAGAIGAVLVVAVGLWMQKRARAKAQQA